MSKFYFLITSDNKKIKVDKTFINSSNLLKDLISDLGNDDREVEIPVNLDSSILTRVTQSDRSRVTNSDLTQSLNFEDLSKLILAANYLEIPNLINDYSKAIADFLKRKTIEELEELSKN